MRVSVEKVLKSYLTQELHKIFNYELDKKVVRLAIENLSEGERWALLEGLAGSFELTGIFSEISDSGYKWELLEIPIEKISLGPMYKEVNSILKKCNFRSQKVVEEIKTSPRIQGEFFGDKTFFKKVKDLEPALALKQKEKTQLIDGHHRVLALAFLGETKLKVFVASKIPGKKGTKLLPRYPMHILGSIGKSAKKTEDIKVRKAIETIFKFLKRRKKYRNIDDFLSLDE